MRVALSGWFWKRPETGSGQYIRQLVRALEKHSPTTSCKILLPYSDVAQPSLGAHISFLPLLSPLKGDLGKLWWEQVTVPRAARRLGVDVLHIPYWAPPVASAVPTVVTVHDVIPLLLPAYRGRMLVRLYTALVSAATSRASFVLADSEASRQDITRHLHVLPERVKAVPLAVDAAYGQQDASEVSSTDAGVLAQFDLLPGYVLYLGGFDIRKNLHTLFKAFAKVNSVLEDVELVVGGKLPQSDTSFAPDPRRLMREAGVPGERVHFLDFVPEAAKPALYRNARVFVFPSIYEGFGLPPLEAISCGTPVVASYTSSLPEVVGNAGILLEPDDVAGMAGAIIQLLSDEAVYAAFCNRTREQALRFSWETVARETWEIYQSVFASVKSPKPYP